MKHDENSFFIVDVSNAHKTSEIIYELSNILNMPEAQGKKIRLKLGEVNLAVSQLKSIKALVECMNSELGCIAAASEETKASAAEIGVEVAEIENKVHTPDFAEEDKDKASIELEKALDKIFGDDYFNTYEYDDTPAVTFDLDETPAQKAETVEPAEASGPAEQPAPAEQPGQAELTEPTEPTQPAEQVEPVVSGICLATEIHAALNEHVPDKDEYLKEPKASDRIILDEEGNDITEEVKKNIRATEKLPTLYIQRNIRSGQSITSDGNLAIIGSIHPGAEVIAAGDITVWGILAGIAHAGCEGNKYARVRALKMNAIQLRIADIFARRPDTINLPYIQKSDSYMPEEASVRDGRIVIQKLHEEI
jgi:septum site-determining protein MinC